MHWAVLFVFTFVNIKKMTRSALEQAGTVDTIMCKTVKYIFYFVFLKLILFD